MSQSKKLFTPLRVAMALLLVLVFTLPLATPALASTVIEGNPDAVIPADQVIDDDVFISGRFVRIDGTVNGDVFAAGQQVVVNGTIDGNLFIGAQDAIMDGVVDDSTFIGAQTVSVGGQVGDNLYAGAYVVDLTGEGVVSGNVYFGGFSFMTEEATQIARSIYAGGYQLNLNGDVGRNVDASLGAFQLNGQVAGNVYLDINESTGAGSSADNFTLYMPGNVVVLPEGIASDAESHVGGEFESHIVHYQSPRVPNGNEIGTNIASSLVGNWVRTRVGEFMALLILGVLLFYLLPKPAAEGVAEMRERPFANMGWGFLVALVAPLAFVVSILLLVSLAIVAGILTFGGILGTVFSVGGASLALFWAVFGLLFWMVSKLLFAYLIGYGLMERVSPSAMEGPWAALIVLVAGLLLYELVRAIPFLGALLALFVILVGVGAIFQVLRTRWMARQSAA